MYFIRKIRISYFLAVIANRKSQLLPSLRISLISVWHPRDILSHLECFFANNTYCKIVHFCIRISNVPTKQQVCSLGKSSSIFTITQTRFNFVQFLWEIKYAIEHEDVECWKTCRRFDVPYTVVPS